MGVMDYSKNVDLEDTIELNENEILKKLNLMQTQIAEIYQLVKELKNDIDQLKTR